jgi:hypothetical protein
VFVDRPGWSRRGAGIIATVAILVSLASARASAERALSRRIANYAITATYDAQAHWLSGRAVIRWHNTTRVAAPDLCFHLYLNAFANSESTFMRGLGGAGVDWQERHPDGWGYIEVRALRIGERDLTAQLQFVQPDDANPHDRTVARLPLEAPVRPGGSIEVDVEFVAQLPAILARTGHAGSFAMVAQWFPKLGVFRNGTWNCHQYHRNTEFFADFGVYDVTLTVPQAAVVGATGVLQAEHGNADGTKTLKFHAADVHDFAWALDPRFRVFERTVDNVAVRLLMQPNHVGQVARHVDAVRTALRYYRSWIGDYPYPQLTIVDPGPGGRQAGGMEYPTLITVGTTWWMPEAIRLPEAVTIHEFGHQYWYGMVASNEFEDAWLDEGINTYLEARIMDAAYGPGSYVNLFGIEASSVPLLRLRYLMAASQDPMVRPAWEFRDTRSYVAVTYAKTALALETLARFIGHDRLQQGLQRYFQRWQFRHPDADAFLTALEEGAGSELDWYVDAVVRGTGILDYAVTQAEATEIEPFVGYPFADGTVGELQSPAESLDRWFRSEVVVERLGDVVMPVNLQIVFDDGTNTSETWDGRDRWKRFEYRGNQRVEWAVVDPGDTMPLDFNRLNNSRMRGAGTRGIVRLVLRWAFWFQSLVLLSTGL